MVQFFKRLLELQYVIYRFNYILECILLESETVINCTIQCNALQYLVYVLVECILTDM